MDGAERVSSLVNNPLVKEHGFETPNLIDSQSFDDCFVVANGTEKFKINLVDNKNGLDFTIWQSAGVDAYNYCQIYTPPSRKEIAIEPVSCPPNGLNTKEGVFNLEPEEKVEMSIGVDF